MNKAISNNPVGRINEFLTRARTKESGEQAWKVYAELFGKPAKHHSEFFEFVVKLSQARKDLVNSIEVHLPHKKDLLLRYLPVLDSVIYPAELVRQWEFYRSKISTELLYSLEMCDHELTPIFVSPEFLKELPKIKLALASVLE